MLAFFARIGDLTNPHALEQAKELLRQKKIEVDTSILSLPRRNVTTRYLKLPTNQNEEIDKMLKLQVPKLLPYAPGEIVYGWRKIGSDEQGYTSVMVILAQQDLVRQQCSFLEHLGIKVSRVILSSQAVCSWLKAIKRDELRNENVILVDIDSLDADIIFLNQGELVFTRTIAHQGNDTAQSQGWQIRLADEIERSIKTADKEIGSLKISRIFFCANAVFSKGIDAALSSKFLSPVEVIPVFSEKLSVLKAAIEPALASGVSFTGVLGAALGETKLYIDLLPPEIKAKINYQQFKAERIKSVSLILLILILIAGLFIKHIADKARLVNALDERVKVLLPQASTREQINLHFQNIRSELKSSSFISELLREVYNSMPQNISLATLNIQRDKFLIIKGEANNLSDVLSLVRSLEKSKYFKNVRVRYAAKRRVREFEVTDFQVDCPLKGVLK